MTGAAAPAVHLALGEAVSSAALLGVMSTLITPSLFAAWGSLDGSLHEPSGGTARPPSRTPVSAAGEGAVSDRMLAPRKPRPTRRRTATPRAPGGSSSTTTT
jgi:hypothetical protein